MTTPTRQFANDDDAAQHWLTLLRDGDPDQKITAREQLATIFERRGMYEEAADLLASNVRDGVRNADIFRWLARLYRAQGDEVTAMQAAAEAAKYMQTAAPPPIVEAAPAPTVQMPPIYATQAPTRRPMGKLKMLSIGCLAIVLGLCALGMIGALVSPSSSRSSAQATSAPTGAPAEKPAAAPAPTTAPKPEPKPTAAPPTPTTPPDPAQAQYLDPRELVAEPKAHVGKNILLQGKALNVEHREEQKGILSTTPAHSWINLQAAVRGKQGSTESVVVEFYPRDTKILKDECYQLRGVVSGTQKVRRLLTGAENEVPVVRGYQWQPVQAGQFGLCPPP